MSNSNIDVSKNLLDKEQYVSYIEKVSPKQSLPLALTKAFAVGGVICCLGEAFIDIAQAINPSISAQTAGTWSNMLLISITVFLTGLGVFDKIGLFAGAGSFLPITGFANSIASAALEYKSEGLVFGLSTKFFNVAGPVIVNGVLGAFLVGLIYFVIGLFR